MSNIIIDKNAFTDTEKRGLLGKIINFFDATNTNYEEPFSDFTIRKMKEYFSSTELLFIYNQISKCENRIKQRYGNSILSWNANEPRKRSMKRRFIDSLPILTEGKTNKVFEYLRISRQKFIYDRYANPIIANNWLKYNSDNFLCGLVGNMRKNREQRTQKLLPKVYDKIENKTNADVLKEVKSFIDRKSVV